MINLDNGRPKVRFYAKIMEKYLYGGESNIWIKIRQDKMANGNTLCIKPKKLKTEKLMVNGFM